MKIRCLTESYGRTVAGHGRVSLVRGEVADLPDELARELLASFPSWFEAVGEERLRARPKAEPRDVPPAKPRRRAKGGG